MNQVFNSVDNTSKKSLKAKLKEPIKYITLSLLFISLSVLLSIGYYLQDKGFIFNQTAVDLTPITEWKAPDHSLVFDRNNKKIAELYNEHHIYLSYKNIPKDFINAVVAIEDKRFWEHQGVDPQAIIRAGISYIKNKGKIRQGASTITQQLVRHFLLTKEKSFTRKLKEASLAIKLEKKLSKEKIFEIYANSLFLGNRSYGVAAAAVRYFGKDIKQLKLPELSLLAGLFQSPSYYNPHKHPKRAKKRQKKVLRAMMKNNFISKQEALIAYKTQLNYKTYKFTADKIAPYFIDYIKSEAKKLTGSKSSIFNKGMRIYTTLDLAIQKMAETSINRANEHLQKASKQTIPYKDKQGRWAQRELEAALLVTSSQTGEVLAMVGGRNYKRSQFNRTTQAKRSPGSAFKPIVYSYALKQGKKWNDLVYVTPVSTEDNYRPRGSHSNYLTETTLLRAFYKSMNSPTVELAQLYGMTPIIKHAKSLGISSPIKKELGSALGASEVTMLELAKSYATFANSGIRSELISIRKITDREGNILYKAPSLSNRQQKALSPQISYLMTQAMKNVFQRGTAYKAYEMSKWAVGKTGTSNLSKDNWFCGFTTDLTAIAWVGTDDFTQILGKSSGAELALPIWKDFMTKAIEKKQPKEIEQPPGVVSVKVNPQFGNKSSNGIDMWFTENNQPQKETSALETLSLKKNYRSIFSQ